MDIYGRTEGMQPDPVGEWSSPGGETGLEEPMWQLGLGAGSESYPERPDEADCIYYLKTGFCGYGARCRFNHPRDRISVVGALRTGGGEYPERAGQPVCQYYMRTGMCKFGASCKYHHPREGGGSTIPIALNISGYPLRPGEKECSYFLKTGQCKFGLTCKFNHPQPDNIQIALPPPSPPAAAVHPHTIYPAPAPVVQSPPVPSSQQYGVVSSNWPVPRPAMIPGSYIPGTYAPVLLPHGMVPYTGWNPYQGALSPVASPNTQPAVGASPLYGFTPLSPAAPAYTGSYLSSAVPSGSSQRENAFPERPGQPECHYYMKTGDCKYGSSCRYHHPLQWSADKPNYNLSLMGLPIRPGAPLCSHYAQNGVCKFGPACKFDHPMGTLSYSPSTSSLADMPVAPYPVGSTIGTLAPSSSSSDLKHELTVSNKDSFSTRMSSSMSTSTGSIYSRSAPTPASTTTTTTTTTSAIASTGGGSSSSSSSGHGGELPSN